MSYALEYQYPPPPAAARELVYGYLHKYLRADFTLGTYARYV